MTDGKKLSLTIRSAGLTVESAARELEIEESTLRDYCDGVKPTPRVVMLAAERVYDKHVAGAIMDAIRDPDRVCNA